MQTGYTGYVDRSEWWWTTIVSLTFILAAFIPFLIIVFLNPVTSDIQFMGAMHDFQDSAADIARMQQGADGDILVDFLYTSSPQDAALIDLVYVLLGKLGRLIELSQTILFHMMRIFVSLFMYLTIYHLGANIWVRVRTRRIFFVLASVSAGFGWLFAILTGGHSELLIPDLSLPQAFPIHASAANIHYPLAISCLALIASTIIGILRPGESEKPMPDNGGGLVFIASLVLALAYPEALLPLGIAYALNVVVNWSQSKKITAREWYWGLWILVPALPIITYNLLTFVNNPDITEWVQQRASENMPVWLLVAALIIPVSLALPALTRAVRRFEADGDRFMLLWLLSMVVTTYLPLQLNQYLLIAITLPLAYFATRATEDFWFNYIPRRFRPRVYILFIPILVMSHIFWMFLPIYPFLQGWQNHSDIFFAREYSNTLIEFDLEAPEDSIVLASPRVSLWIPAWTGLRVVYGHPDETMNAPQIHQDVILWFEQSDPNAEICQRLIDDHDIDFVIYGPRERRLGAGACVENLELRQIFGQVEIYATRTR